MVSEDVWVSYRCLCPYCGVWVEIFPSLSLVHEKLCTSCMKTFNIMYKLIALRKPVARASSSPLDTMDKSSYKGSHVSSVMIDGSVCCCECDYCGMAEHVYDVLVFWCKTCGNPSLDAEGFRFLDLSKKHF